MKRCCNPLPAPSGAPNLLEPCRETPSYWFVGHDKVYRYLCDSCVHARAYRHLNPQPMVPVR